MVIFTDTLQNLVLLLRREAGARPALRPQRTGLARGQETTLERFLPALLLQRNTLAITFSIYEVSMRII